MRMTNQWSKSPYIQTLIACLAITLFFPNFAFSEKLASSPPYGYSHSHVFSDVGCVTYIGEIGVSWMVYSQHNIQRITDCWISADLWNGFKHIHFFTRGKDKKELQAHCITAENRGEMVQARATVWDRRPKGGISVDLIDTRYVPKPNQ